MRLKTCLIVCLMSVSVGVAAASCATQGSTWPSAEDLRVEPAPVPTADILTSRVAGERYDNARDAHSEAGWAKVGRLCRFFAGQGMPLPFECPLPHEEIEALRKQRLTKGA